MAIDRNKIAQQAERLVLQGKIAEAIVQYELLVRDNSRDMNTINKIGDLYSKQGKKREAILQFNKIGEFYAKDGFFLKAIAIYKKITKLDSTFLDAYQRLADLYAQQGLVLEARSQYLMVAEQFLKAGEIKKGIAAFKALVRVDPENLKHRGHLADLLARDGQTAEAAEEYERLGAELERKGREPEAREMYQKGSAIQPGSPAVVARQASALATAGDVEGGIKMLKDFLRKPGDHKDLLSLLGDLHSKAGQSREAESAYLRAIEQAPERSFLKLSLARLFIEKGDAGAAYQAVSPHLQALTKDGHVREAVALLDRITQLDEGHVEALMRLAEIHAAQKRESDLMKCGHRAIDISIDRGDYAAARRHATALLKLRPGDGPLKEKLSQLKATEAAPAPSARSTEPSSLPEDYPGAMAADFTSALDLPAPMRLEPEDEDFIAEHMTEADVFMKYGLGDRAVEQLVSVIERYPGHVPALSKLKEIYLEEGNREGARQQMARIVKSYLSSGEGAQAEEMLAELKRFDPNCREAAELSAAMFPGAAHASHAGVMAQSAMGAPMLVEEEDVAETLEGSVDRETAEAEPEPEPDENAPSAEELEEVDFFLGQGLREEAVGVLRRLATEYGSHPEIVSRMRIAMALQAAKPGVEEPAGESEEFEITVEETESAQPPTPEPPSDLADLSDLASEIDAVLSGEAEHNESLLTDVEATPEGHSLEEIVQAFKKGIEQQVGAEDFDTHYNLGIAYKEMGLMDEAIGEFQFAAKDERLLVDCCSMLGICFREKGMSTLAVKWYRRGLEESASRDEDTTLGLKYDLAELFVDMGEHRQAMDLFTEVFGTNSKYRDVATRIKELERQSSR